MKKADALTGNEKEFEQSVQESDIASEVNADAPETKQDNEHETKRPVLRAKRRMANRNEPMALTAFEIPRRVSCAEFIKHVFTAFGAYLIINRKCMSLSKNLYLIYVFLFTFLFIYLFIFTFIVCLNLFFMFSFYLVEISNYFIIFSTAI